MLKCITLWRSNPPSPLMKELREWLILFICYIIAYSSELGDLVAKGWQLGAKAGRQPVTPWTKQDWIAKGKWHGTK